MVIVEGNGYVKSSLYIYIKYIWFGLVWFYGISTIVRYLMPNPLFTYILNIWFEKPNAKYSVGNGQVNIWCLIVHNTKRELIFSTIPLKKVRTCSRNMNRNLHSKRWKSLTLLTFGMSIASEVLFMKETDSPAKLVRWLKRTHDLGGLFKHSNKGDHSI